MCFSAVNRHAVILGQLPSVLKLRNQAIPVEEKLDSFPVLGVYQAIRVPRSRCEEVFSLILNLQFAGFLLCGKLSVLRAGTVNVINQVIMGSKSFGNLCIGDALLPVCLHCLLGLNLRVDVLYANDDVLSVTCHDLRMTDIADLSVHDQTPG